MNISKFVRNAAFAISAAMAGASAHAQIVAPVENLDINLIGIAVGSVPDYMGSGDRTGAAGPIVRYQLEGSQRYFVMLGPQIMFNVLDDDTWRFGPYANFRAGRGDDVDDPIVKQMVGINNTWEGGVFLQYNMKLSNVKLHQLVFSGDIAGSGNGTVGHLRMMWWQPLAQDLIFNLGVGTTFANDKWMRTYYGVTQTQDVSLFGGRVFEPSSGFAGINIPVGISYMVNKEWLLSAGARFEKLQGDAKDSPIVQQRGDETQWVFGVAASYMF